MTALGLAQFKRLKRSELNYGHNVGAMLAQALAMADLIRIEVHGPAAELAKLKEPLAHLKPAWFELHS